MKIRIAKSEKGVALIAVAISAFILAILGFSLLSLVRSEILLTKNSVNRTKAFYLAEAGLGRLSARLYTDEYEDIEDTALGDGIYRVDVYRDENPPYAISTGRVGGEERKIKVGLLYLASYYDDAVYAGNLDGQPWTFGLRGQGDPETSGSRWTGGRDIVNGDIYANGDVTLCEESSVNPALPPNTFGLDGDVDATGSIDLRDSATVSGSTQGGVPPLEDWKDPDLLGMDYHINNSHNVSQVFADAGVSNGYLPSGHELRDVVMRNPSDRSSECSSTAGDDYFFEPASVSGGGDQTGAPTPLHLGENRVYYVDGNVWIHSKSTYGFTVDGSVTIVATGDVRICDNVAYGDDQSLLGIVALGTYDSEGELTGGGNIYFGDPRYGTTYTVSAMMFAADDFLYNTDSISGSPEEPTTGFSIFGNLAALDQVSIERDWYDDGTTGSARPAHFDSSTNQWVDLENGSALSAGEIGSLRHYQMIVSYDDRVRTIETQPPGLPKGGGTIYAGLMNWEEVTWDQ